MTEEQAKTRTCHLTLAPVSMAPDFPVHAPQSCIGSQCMQWRIGTRWRDGSGYLPAEDEADAKSQVRASGGRGHESNTRVIVRHCGLGSRP